MIGRKELRVFVSIRRQLLLGQWEPEARLKPAELASDLGVSPSPVREALIRLAERGLVVNIENLGFVVAQPDPYASEAYCNLLARLYGDSIARVAAAGRLRHAAADLTATLADTTGVASIADAFLEATAAFRRVLLITPFQAIAEQLDDAVAIHAALTVASPAYYERRQRELATFASILSSAGEARLSRAIRIYFTQRALEITRASVRLAGLPMRPNPKSDLPRK